MKIESIANHVFHLPFQAGLVSINVQAPSQEEAAQIIKDWMQEAQKELALLFPQVAPMTPVPTEFNALQISLLEDLSKACGYEGNIDLPSFIKQATGFEMTLENVKKIIPALETLRDGGQPNGKKK